MTDDVTAITYYACAACPDYLEKRDLASGDFCTVHWATIELEVPGAGFKCDHHEH